MHFMRTLKEIKDRFLRVSEPNGISEKELNYIQIHLNVLLPDDFKNIATFFSGCFVGSIDMYDFIASDINIISETLRLRCTIDLPHRFVVLAELSESLVIMDTEQSPSVIWCDSCDAENIGKSDYSIKPDVWDSYSDFFDDMISEELDSD